VSEEPTKDTHPNAGRASGYTDGSGNSVGENVINVVTGLVSTIETKLLLGNEKTQARLNAIVEAQNAIISTQDRRFDYMLGQLAAQFDKEDTRHDTINREKEQDEKNALAALTSVAHRLDEITSYVQQSVTLAREGIAIGKEARATGIEALAIAKAGAARLGKVEKAITTLKAGQVASKKQVSAALLLLQESKEDRADLRERIEALSAVVEEHNRVSAEHDALVSDVAEMKARLAALEAREHGDK
jgi:5'-3' exonuclease